MCRELARLLQTHDVVKQRIFGEIQRLPLREIELARLKEIEAKMAEDGEFA